MPSPFPDLEPDRPLLIERPSERMRTILEGIRDVHAPGVGQIEVTRAAGRSRVTRAYATSPLRLLTPRNHGDAAWIYAASYGGGLLGGDRVQLSVQVANGARAFLSTQASTKIYRSDRPA